MRYSESAVFSMQSCIITATLHGGTGSPAKITVTIMFHQITLLEGLFGLSLAGSSLPSQQSWPHATEMGRLDSLIAPGSFARVPWCHSFHRSWCHVDRNAWYRRGGRYIQHRAGYIWREQATSILPWRSRPLCFRSSWWKIGNWTLQLRRGIGHSKLDAWISSYLPLPASCGWHAD